MGGANSSAPFFSMARTSTQIQADIDTMSAALGNPAREIRFQDRTVVYASEADKLLGMAALQRELQIVTGSIPTRQYRIYTDQGYGE